MRKIVLAVLSASLGSAAGPKLSGEQRIELIRGLTAEYATAKAALPRSKKPLEYNSSGQYDRKKWDEAGREMGPAARVGDLIQVTKVDIEDDKIVFEINNGVKGKRRWYHNIEVGTGGRTSPINADQSTAAPGGTSLVLLFGKPLPATLEVAEVKTMLKPVLDFEKRTATESYVESLPPEIKQAVTEKRAVEGMDRDQVLLALGRPRHKTRDIKDGTELEDWIYGQPPGKIVFVTFEGSKVVKVKESYAGLGGATAPPLPVR